MAELAGVRCRVGPVAGRADFEAAGRRRVVHEQERPQTRRGCFAGGAVVEGVFAVDAEGRAEHAHRRVGGGPVAGEAGFVALIPAEHHGGVAFAGLTVFY